MPPLSQIDTSGLSPSLIGNTPSLSGAFGIGPSNTAVVSDASGNVSLGGGKISISGNTSTVSSGVLQTTGIHFPSGEAMTEWYNGYHCNQGPSGENTSWLHVRTPIPADAAAGVGWIPYLLEFKGYHTYGGEIAGIWGAIVNTTGDGNNSWYGSQIKYNVGTYTPYVYRSTNTYGGYTRMCFAVNKQTCCCNGWWWARVNINHGFRASYPWGQIGSNSQTTASF